MFQAMIGSIFSQLQQSFGKAERWYRSAPERSIEDAYKAAIAIKRIEDEHFDGQPITLDPSRQRAVASYFESELNQNLRLIRNRLAAFKVSRFFVSSDAAKVKTRADITRLSSRSSLNLTDYTLNPQEYTSEVETDPPQDELLRKLAFIDAVIAQYDAPPAVNNRPSNGQLHGVKSSGNRSLQKNAGLQEDGESLRSVEDSFYESEFTAAEMTGEPSQLNQSSFIPRSILRTATRFRKELNPDQGMEDEIIRDFRNSRTRTRAATRFLLLLIILPLLTQQLSKNLLIGPIVDHFEPPEQIEIQINPAVERKVLDELTIYKERLEFNNLLSPNPISNEGVTEELRRKAQGLSKTYQWELREPIRNFFADALSLVVFAILIATGKQDIAVLKSFMDEILYNLSDSAKAFILILFTDVFVGFHSPHGWEVVIERSLEHFGLPQNRDFINMFIATFPVMLDTVFKYWIFRYLNQVSPSAVATYRNMNE